MILNSSSLAKYRGYVLYGRSVEDLLRRALAFSGGCEKLIVDTSLGEPASKLCTKGATIVELRGYEDVDRVIASNEEGKALVFVVEAPKEGVHAIALIPIDRFNKARAGGG